MMLRAESLDHLHYYVVLPWYFVALTFVFGEGNIHKSATNDPTIICVCFETYTKIVKASDHLSAQRLMVKTTT